MRLLSVACGAWRSGSSRVYEAFRILPVRKGKLPSAAGESSFRFALQWVEQHEAFRL